MGSGPDLAAPLGARPTIPVVWLLVQLREGLTGPCSTCPVNSTAAVGPGVGSLLAGLIWC